MAGASVLSWDRGSRYVPGGAGGAAPRRRSGLARRRAELEARWRMTLERVTGLSVAYHDAAAARLPAGPAAAADDSAGALRACLSAEDISRLARRVVAERQALAEIEAALDRIAVGRYGRCEQCGHVIPARLLARQPQARFCSACSRRSAPLPAYA